jgi:hypothetical protein
MAGKLITLPLRVWLGSARLLTRAAGDVAGCAVSLAGHAIGAVAPTHAHPEPPRPQAPEPPRPEFEDARPAADPPRQPAPRDVPAAGPERTSVSSVTPVRPAVARPTPPPQAPPVREPIHVSEEPELVREEAEPGAEDGAGAAVTVMEPWDGYRHMNAREVIARARQATRAELAAVRLYEARHRSRQTVLAAVDRQLKTSNGSDPA